MSTDLLSKLNAIKQRFDEVADLIIQPDVVSDQARFAKLNKEYSDLNLLVEIRDRYQNKLSLLEEANEIIKAQEDPEMVEMAKMEKDQVLEEIPMIEQEIRLMLIPKDPEDEKNVIVELRAGTGGDEACIFVEDMWRMYSMAFKELGWSSVVVSSSEGTVKGYKELVMEVSGQSVYGTLKYESGVHRVQRVPETESQGRVHTSAITVAVLPEAEEVDVQLNMSDVRVDTFRASGAGGQHVNKTESAIRLTHIPTGVVAECQEERSQHKNKDKAIKYLRSKLYQIELDRAHSERSEQRKSLVSSGDRSAKIKTYNYPQGRVTDHRIGKSIYSLDAYMNGSGLLEMIESVKMTENAERLKGEEGL
ncbi:MAG: peptide chain release factor 1 [Flavobacteriaceae bacterium]|nr:MAG: peptide chain release factor 1 [Flavobacteriaceae bacterium]